MTTYETAFLMNKYTGSLSLNFFIAVCKCLAMASRVESLDIELCNASNWIHAETPFITYVQHSPPRRQKTALLFLKSSF